MKRFINLFLGLPLLSTLLATTQGCKCKHCAPGKQGPAGTSGQVGNTGATGPSGPSAPVPGTYHLTRPPGFTLPYETPQTCIPSHSISCWTTYVVNSVNATHYSSGALITTCPCNTGGTGCTAGSVVPQSCTGAGLTGEYIGFGWCVDGSTSLALAPTNSPVEGFGC